MKPLKEVRAELEHARRDASAIGVAAEDAEKKHAKLVAAKKKEADSFDTATTAHRMASEAFGEDPDDDGAAAKLAKADEILRAATSRHRAVQERVERASSDLSLARHGHENAKREVRRLELLVDLNVETSRAETDPLARTAANSIVVALDAIRGIATVRQRTIAAAAAYAAEGFGEPPVPDHVHDLLPAYELLTERGHELPNGFFAGLPARSVGLVADPGEALAHLARLFCTSTVDLGRHEGHGVIPKVKARGITKALRAGASRIEAHAAAGYTPTAGPSAVRGDQTPPPAVAPPFSEHFEPGT